MQTAKYIYLFSAATLALAASCKTSNTVHVRKDAPELHYNQEKFLVLPINTNGLPGSSEDYNTALSTGFVGAFGTQGVSLQPVEPQLEEAGMGDLSPELARGIQEEVERGNFDLKEAGSAELAVIPEKMGQLAEMSASALGLDFKPRFVAIAHVEGKGEGDLPETYNYSVIGAIYDLQLEKVHAATYYDKTTAKDALIGEMATIGKQLFKALSEGQSG